MHGTLTAEGLAEYLGVSTRTVWRLMKTGELPPGRMVAGNWRWSVLGVDLWLAGVDVADLKNAFSEKGIVDSAILTGDCQGTDWGLTEPPETSSQENALGLQYLQNPQQIAESETWTPENGPGTDIALTHAPAPARAPETTTTHPPGGRGVEVEGGVGEEGDEEKGEKVEQSEEEPSENEKQANLLSSLLPAKQEIAHEGVQHPEFRRRLRDYILMRLEMPKQTHPKDWSKWVSGYVFNTIWRFYEMQTEDQWFVAEPHVLGAAALERSTEHQWQGLFDPNESFKAFRSSEGARLFKLTWEIEGGHLKQWADSWQEAYRNTIQAYWDEVNP